MNLATIHPARTPTAKGTFTAADQRAGEQAIWRALGQGAPTAGARAQRRATVVIHLPAVMRMKRSDKLKVLRTALTLEDEPLLGDILSAVDLPSMRPALSEEEAQPLWTAALAQPRSTRVSWATQTAAGLARAGLDPQFIPLHSFVIHRNLVGLEQAVALGANPNQIRNAETPLILAARVLTNEQHCIEVVDVLLAGGAIPLVMDARGRRPSEVAHRPNTMNVYRHLKSAEDRMQLAFAAGLTGGADQGGTVAKMRNKDDAASGRRDAVEEAAAPVAPSPRRRM